MENKILKICERSEGYKYEGPRYRDLGPFSGQEFREEHLLPWLNSLTDKEKGIIDFEGTAVYSPSFLEESFGGAIRKNAKNGEKLSNVSFNNIDPIWKEKVEKYIKLANKSNR
ncbi:MAG: STAS-like domain-containing protein [Tannerellaceae bacterium]|jgi:hypothetical protein|nr:STAS-like domain-containing protein [Tannerellaceae bacterium]